MEGGVSSALLPFLALGMGPVSLCAHLWGYLGDARALSLSLSLSSLYWFDHSSYLYTPIQIDGHPQKRAPPSQDRESRLKAHACVATAQPRTHSKVPP